jgi:hypothetical protein
MSIRLYSTEQRERATSELLAILADHPEGVRTKDLRGTSRFHGGSTLSSRQIIRLLRESGRVEKYLGGQGNHTYSFWKLAKQHAQLATT